MRPFTPYFHCDCVKNARNGTTIAVLFSLPQQKYNAKFSHKSKLPTLAQKDFVFHTAQEGIKMTALRGKSRISLPLRLPLSCAKPTLPSDAAFICKQQRRVGINFRSLNNKKLLFHSRLCADYQEQTFYYVIDKKRNNKATTYILPKEIRGQRKEETLLLILSDLKP